MSNDSNLQGANSAQAKLREAAEKVDVAGVRDALKAGANPKLLPEQLTATVEAIQRRFAADGKASELELDRVEEAIAINAHDPQQQAQAKLREAAENADTVGVHEALKAGANPKLLPEQLTATVEAIQRRFAVDGKVSELDMDCVEDAISIGGHDPQQQAQTKLREAAEKVDVAGVREALKAGANPKLLPEQLTATVEAIQRRFADRVLTTQIPGNAR